jgi:ATP-dependent Clp protease protease subunit
MPVGVPKVPFRLPGEASAQWSDLYNRLYRQRILFLGQDLDDELANQLCGIMMYLSAEDENMGMYMYINSPGGSMQCGIAVYDVINFIEASVTTIGMGMCASMASFVLAGGNPGKRIALPHARIMMHQPDGGVRGQGLAILTETIEVQRLRRQVALLYVERTGQELWKIARDMDRDTFMDAREAKQYGLVDQVTISMNGITGAAGRNVGFSNPV